MEQKLPDGNDIYGYPGITKASLVIALDTAYVLSQEIKEDDETRFEVISLKRAGSAIYKRLKEYLEADSAEADKKIGFNDFLDDLSSLVEKAKLTYFIVAKHGIRDDEELAKIRATIAELTVLKDELNDRERTVASKVEAIGSAVEQIEARHKSTGKMAGEIEGWHTTSNKYYGEMETTHEAITGWDEDVKNCAAQFQEKDKQFSAVVAAACQSRDSLKNDASIGTWQVKEIKTSAEEHRKLLDEIRQTLEGANRVGMAASFQARKKELGIQLGIWQCIFVAAIIAIGLAVWKFLLPTITADTKRWTELCAELAIVFPLIWLGWFAAKQYGYISKIREDYAFKSAAAMAYEGHKKAAREVDKNLERVLLELSLYNMAQNPIRLYGDGEMHGTPLHEVMEQILDKFPNLQKVSANVPPLGRVEIEGQTKTADDSE